MSEEEQEEQQQPSTSENGDEQNKTEQAERKQKQKQGQTNGQAQAHEADTVRNGEWVHIESDRDEHIQTIHSRTSCIESLRKTSPRCSPSLRPNTNHSFRLTLGVIRLAIINGIRNDLGVHSEGKGHCNRLDDQRIDSREGETVK